MVIDLLENIASVNAKKFLLLFPHGLFINHGL